MNSLDLLLLGIVTVLCPLVVLQFVVRGVRRRKRVLLDRVEQLSNRLNEQLVSQSTESTESGQQQERDVTGRILDALQESQSHPEIDGGFGLSSHLSSIQPVQSSVAILSKRIAELEEFESHQKKSQVLNLTSLAVVYIRCHLSEVIRVQQIADALRVSRSRLYICVKECLDCSVNELVTVIKMHEAKGSSK